MRMRVLRKSRLTESQNSQFSNAHAAVDGDTKYYFIGAQIDMQSLPFDVDNVCEMAFRIILFFLFDFGRLMRSCL